MNPQSHPRSPQSPAGVTGEDQPSPLDINLFAGAGGMALGLIAAGFSPRLLYEVDPYACTTLRDNAVPVDPPISDGVREVDVRKVAWREIGDLKISVRLLAAGVPCQPFSLGGKHLADKDPRNLFPEFLDAVRQLNPQAVFIENVRGLLRPSFKPYLTYLLRQLEFPSLGPGDGESWQDHYERLRRHLSSPGVAVQYRVETQLVNAADYGVPQIRSRAFIVAVRSDIPSEYTFPAPTHSRKALQRVQRNGEYWQRHNVPAPTSTPKVESSDTDCETQLPWVTVRDCISDLPKPALQAADATMDHWFIPGAREYRGHTGSSLDWPAKTIKAGVHGVPGGENTVVNGSGDLRYFTLRETARIQTFPDGHLFHGARIHVTRQIGNAVPTTLACALSRPLYELLVSPDTLAKVRI